MLDIFEFFASWWSEIAWYGQFVVLQINYDVIKLQKYQLWRNFGVDIKLRHKITSQKFSIKWKSIITQSNKEKSIIKPNSNISTHALICWIWIAFDQK